MATQSGKVKWFDERRGFGFIAPDDGSKELFVHCSQIQDRSVHTLAENQSVTFEVRQGMRGPEASKIRLA